MANVESNKSQPEQIDNTLKMNAKIKETWSKLSDEDIKLYSGKRDQFIAKLKEKQNLSKEDAEKHLQEIEKACGCNSGAAKAA